MEIVKILLFFYAATVVVNVALTAGLWWLLKNRIYAYTTALWVGMFANLFLQGIFDTTALEMILCFSTYYVCSLLLARIMELTSGISVPYKAFHLLQVIGLAAAISFDYLGLGFTISALPVSIAVASPILFASFACWRSKNSSGLERVYATLLAINALHLMDYPFLRPLPELAVFGFSLAFGLMILLSIYLPIFTTKNISDRYAKLLEQEIEHRKHTEHNLRKQKVRAEAAAKAKSEFLTNMSHEIRTPLNGMMGVAEVLLLQNHDAETQELLREMNFSGERLLETVSNILEYSSLQSRDEPFSEKLQSIEPMVRALVDAQASHVARKGLVLSYTIDNKVPVSMYFDAVALQQALTHLLNNAIRFTGSGRIDINVSLEEDRTGNEQLLFEVRDTGIGIPEDKLESIFEPFNQADNSSARQYEGIGLGLNIVQELVRLMGGKISCQSESGVATSFYLFIPARAGASLSPQEVSKGV